MLQAVPLAAAVMTETMAVLQENRISHMEIMIRISDKTITAIKDIRAWMKIHSQMMDKSTSLMTICHSDLLDWTGTHDTKTKRREMTWHLEEDAEADVQSAVKFATSQQTESLTSTTKM
ncbi:hypothetical protein B14911_01755 [Bacillus sp. NRRL B-14911]|nr:hypothetical protein B14911_01755 [Bacillus sp. NRRL B-14911]